MATVNELTYDPAFRCVSTALLPLNPSYIKGIADAIKTTTGLITAYVESLHAQLIALNINSVPLLLKKAGLEQAAKQVTDSINSIGEAADKYEAGVVEVNVVARELTSACPALGKVNEIAVSAVEAPLAVYRRVSQQVDRAQALRIKLETQMDRLNAYARYLNRIATLCESILTAKNATEVTWNIATGGK